MKEPKIIALDCDDVLLDYNQAWGDLYTKFFNLKSFDKPINPIAYHAAEYWGVNWENRTHEFKEFSDYFTKNAWKDMNALNGAVEATHILKDFNYKIFVISRMPESGEKDRAENLYNLNFKFDAVIGTGHTSEYNPKKPYIEKLQPEYFVDDLIANFNGIIADTKFVWLNVGRILDENEELKNICEIHHTHVNLHHFVTSVIKR